MKTLAILVLASSAALVVAQQTAPPPPPPTDIAGFDADSEPDQPGRPVARLSVASGDVSVKRGDHTEWVAGALNAPLMEGDSISVSQQGAAEVQFDNSHFARLAGNTEIRLVQIAPEYGQAGNQNAMHRIEVGRGLVTWRVLRQSNVQAEIATPLAGVHPLGLASVRVEVMPDSTAMVTVRHGEVEVQTSRGTERVREGGLMTIRPTGGQVGNESEYQITQASPVDRWDTWSDQRDGYLVRAVSPQYVSEDVYGAEDLDPYGRWSNDPQYGQVWSPNVAADWAPYRDGRWVWEDYYGWTWIDSQPWGWAPFHYGTWYQRPGYGWCWFPGPRTVRTWWRPAMVGFFGFGSGYGGGFSVGLSFGNIGWVPLAPYERYRPWYGRGGFGGGRNIVVNNINITNVYRNSRYRNAATAVNAHDFERGNYRNRMAIGGEQLRQASLVRGAGLAPTTDHLRFSDRNTPNSGPRGDLASRRFFNGTRGGITAESGTTRTPFSQQQAVVRSRFNGGGAAFQDGGQRSPVQPTAPATRPQGNTESSFGWRRFGNPAPDNRPQPGPAAQNPAFGNPSQGNTTDRRGFSPRNSFPQNNLNVTPPSAPPASAPRQERSPESFGGRRFGGGSNPVDISPPVVRQRDNPGEGRRFNGGGFNGGARFGAPVRPDRGPSASPGQQPRSAPPQARPEGGNRGNGGFGNAPRGDRGGGPGGRRGR
jgi:hypothetical protein